MVRIVGHRGAKNLWPENSLEGFAKLAGLGVEAVEFDVHRTRDGAIAVIHDPVLERTTLGEGPVAAHSLDQLRGIRLRDSAECVPGFDEVLAQLRATDLELHIEIKTDAYGNAYPGFEAEVIEAVERSGLFERAILTCFAPQVLERVRALRPKARVLMSLDRRSCEMMGGIEPAFARIGAIRDCLVAVEKGLLGLTLDLFLDRIGGDRLGVWVPNEAEDIGFWLRQPIRQLTTDRPDLAAQIRTSEAPRRQ